MLTKIIATTGATAKVKKLINFRFDGPNNTLVYTVPEGKTCTGHFFGDINQNGSVSINGTDMWFSRSIGAGTGNTVVPVVLTAGTVLRSKSTSGNCSFIGIEE